eukprot:CAMPEP_0167745936 /NCGR_PEP_ID=MMETSP0110_2-20121227/3427_1 /TAXON_ID=629695 /ORGANISM="Gymnochlora sp., Strain CCMP2014" /LENGTH=334 /DNA_ID=CAMNT_0007630631 /DNA_START=631 /DNA_END=1636 /DNA_ORIENTATION=+
MVFASIAPFLITILLPIVSMPYSKSGNGLLSSQIVRVPKWAMKTYISLLPTWLGQAYSPFSRIVTRRWEAEIEGLDAGGEWRRYEFHMRSSSNDAPKWNTGHEWRLDQIMQSWPDTIAEGKTVPHWFQRFLVRLLENSPHVTSNLARNPFKGRDRPLALRVSIYDRHFINCKLKHHHEPSIGYSFPPDARNQEFPRQAEKMVVAGKLRELFIVELRDGRLVSSPVDPESRISFLKHVRGACQLVPSPGSNSLVPADVSSYHTMLSILHEKEVEHRQNENGRTDMKVVSMDSKTTNAVLHAMESIAAYSLFAMQEKAEKQDEQEVVDIDDIDESE